MWVKIFKKIFQLCELSFLELQKNKNRKKTDTFCPLFWSQIKNLSFFENQFPSKTNCTYSPNVWNIMNIYGIFQGIYISFAKIFHVLGPKFIIFDLVKNFVRHPDPLRLWADLCKRLDFERRTNFRTKNIFIKSLHWRGHIDVLKLPSKQSRAMLIITNKAHIEGSNTAKTHKYLYDRKLNRLKMEIKFTQIAYKLKFSFSIWNAGRLLNYEVVDRKKITKPTYEIIKKWWQAKSTVRDENSSILKRFHKKFLFSGVYGK